jgi:hypothetical protein
MQSVVGHRLKIAALVRSPQLGDELVAAINPQNGTKRRS